jgi:hypothetical protein
MEQLFEIISGIHNPFVLGGVISFVTFIYLTKDSWTEVVSKIGTKSDLQKTKYKISDLTNHDLFHELKVYKTFKINYFTHEKFDETKTKIFHDFLQMKIDITSKNMMEICENATNEMSKVELKSLINESFDSCNIELEKKLVRQFKDKGLSPKDAEIIMSKFYNIRKHSMKKYNKRIDSIFACDFYQTNFDLILALYEVIASEIEDVVEHGKEAFDYVNGTFYNLKYEI